MTACLRRRLLSLLCALVLAGGAILAGGKASKPRITTVHVPFWNTSNDPLTETSLKATLDGAPAKVLRVEGPNSDLILITILDIVSDIVRVDSARQALETSIRAFRPNFWVGLMRAQDGLQVMHDPSSNRDSIAGTIHSFTSVSGANAGLLDTVESACRLGDFLLAKANVRVAILYITDSNITNYREDFANPVINSSDSGDLSRYFPENLVRDKMSKMNDRLVIFQTPVFILHLVYRSDRLNEAYQNGLRQLATTTGGASAFCRSNSEVGDDVRKMIGDIVSHYCAVIQLPNRPLKQVQVQLEGPHGALACRPRFLLRQK